MEWLVHNPIADLPGPSFLGFYAAYITIVLIICRWRLRARDRTLETPLAPIPSHIDPYEVAYLRGAAHEVTRLAIFNLVQGGFVTVKEEKKSAFRRDDARKLVQATNPPDRSQLTSIEHTLFEWFRSARSPAEAFSSAIVVEAAQRWCERYEAHLKRDGFLTGPDAMWAGWRVGLAGAAVIWGMGLYKLCIALSRGRHNVGFLVLMSIASLVLLLITCWPRRLTKRGRAHLDRLRMAFDRLQYRWADQPGELALPLAIGVFGISVLAGTNFDYYPQMFKRAATASSGCGSVAGCGASCGSSSCGGGGCGGGGCGGGGCGGCGGG